ncbi:MAG: outer membrane lipoprotein-sorting protein [Desulfobacula sp.]|nr:outer membrane lipoprotein-sorting protein [Desulfobacula sp.]
MRKIVVTGIWITFCLCMVVPVCMADDERARQIMQQVEDRDDGDNMTSRMLMVLIDKNEKQRKKYFQSFSKDFGRDKKRIMFVKSPAPIKNTGFLTFDWDDESRDDDQWLFLPAIGKTKRIASSDKSSSFMGSDLNYSDMTGRNLEDYNFKLLKESKIKGIDVWIIQSLPKTKEVEDETGYKKSILAVRKDNYIVVRAKMWTSEGGFTKYMDAQKLVQIDGIWVVAQNHITKKRGKVTMHQTLLKLSNVKFNQSLDENVFTIRRLEKGLF